MGLWFDWYSRNAGKENRLINAEFVLKKIDEASALSAPVSHKHTKSDITDFAHTHDDKYYTESEIETKLSTKLNLSGGTITGILNVPTPSL
jgi:hypothetical protein